VPRSGVASPSPDVLAAFGLDGDLEPVSGGQQTVWRVGAAVLKPLDTTPEILGWQEQLLTTLDGRTDFRVAPPLRSSSDALVVDGWTAWRYEPSRHMAGRWADIIAVSRSFHRAVAEVPRPAFLDRRDDPWAVADRVAWGEIPMTDYVDMPHVAELAAALRPIAATPQLTHGDLTGNVLFADGLPPVVLDLSVYWRPPTTASAIVVADALVYEQADRELLDAVSDPPDFAQYLLRALIFRVVVHAGLGPDGGDPFADAVRLALDLAGPP
jgi:uncharacterized protein (TIGR02569 family)